MRNDNVLKYICAILLILFCIQFIPIESRSGVSIIKVAVMAICPVILVAYAFVITKAFVLCVVYLAIIWTSSLLNYETFRASTVIYTSMYLVLYLTFYNLTYVKSAFDYEFYIKLVKGLIMAFVVCLLLQQVLIIVGISTFSPLNLVQELNRGIGANSLSFEPSSSARVMSVLYLALLRMYQLRLERLPKISELFSDIKWPTIGFLWSMLTMGSGTAFIALGLLSFLYIKKQYYPLVPLFLIIYWCIPYIDYEPLQRAYKIIDLTLSGDTEKILKSDGSAASRVAPLLNTIQNTNLFEWRSWVGYGADYSARFDSYVELVKGTMIGRIQEFGLNNFIVMQIIVFTCAIRKFLSIETLFWVFLFGLTFSNISYTWGCMMVFTGVRYFQTQKEQGLIT